jgi:hypothetical protein
VGLIHDYEVPAGTEQALAGVLYPGGDRDFPPAVPFSSLACYARSLRIIVTGDRFWNCHKLAAAILRRLLARYGPESLIVHGDETGFEESFATAARGLRIKTEAHPADFDHLGRTQIREECRMMGVTETGTDISFPRYRFSSCTLARWIGSSRNSMPVTLQPRPAR